MADPGGALELSHCPPVCSGTPTLAVAHMGPPGTDKDNRG